MGIPSLEYKTAALAETADDPGAGGMLAHTGLPTTWQAKSPEFDLTDDPEGTAWAIVAVTGVKDDVGDIIVPGAFRRTLAERQMKGVLGHDWNRPVAVQRAAMELMPGDHRLPDTLADGRTPWPRAAGALLVKASYILGTTDGRDAWVQAQAYGPQSAYSIGYKVTEHGAKHRGDTRHIHDLDVYEFSPVLHGANRLATLQAIKGADAELEFTDAYPDVEGKALRRVQDAAYWGRPVGTVITPGMKPVGPRSRAGARDRGASTRRVDTSGGGGSGVTRVESGMIDGSGRGGQRGVGGGMGAAGLGGIRRDTAAGVRARNARERSSTDRDQQRAGTGDDWTTLNGLAGTGERGDPLTTIDEDGERVPLTAVDTPSLLRADRELSRRINARGGDDPKSKRDRDGIRGVLRERFQTEEGMDLGDDESPDEARARQLSTGNHQAARAALTETLDRLRAEQRERYNTATNMRINNLERVLSRERPLIADRSGRIAAIDQGENDKGRDLGWAVIDTRSGKLLSKGENDDDVTEYVEAAAEAARDADAQEARDGQAGGDGGRALGEVPAGGAGADPAGTAGGALPGAGGRGERGDRDAGGVAGGPGSAGGVVPGEGRPSAGGESRRGGAGGAGDDPAGAGAAGADDAGRRVRGGAGDPDAGGDGDSEGDGGLLQREAGSAADAGAGSDAVADPDTDAGLPAEGATADDLPQVDTQAATRLTEIPPDGEPFRPRDQSDLAPAGARAKLDANMAALRLLRDLQRSDPPRNATPEEQAVLARWSGWGSLPKVFDDLDTGYAAEREELRGLLSPDEWVAARKNTLNAHYTDGRVTRAVWDALTQLGFSEPGADGSRPRKRVLEPGSGSGNFIGMAPDGADMVGVELESTTAAISKYLYPDATIRNEGFEKTKLPNGGFDAVVGNVPYGKYKLYDPVDNPGNNLTVHNHFIMKSLRATRPGGVVAVLTSRYTLDGSDPKAREEMAKLGDLVGAVRLPNGSHRAAAGTDVIEDILIFRRRGEGETPGDQSWVNSAPQDLGIGEELDVNQYFVDNPSHVLGELTARSGRFGPEVSVQGDRDMPGLADALADITARANREGRGFRVRDEYDEPLPALLDPDTTRYEGHIRREADGSFTQARGGGASPLAITSTSVNDKTGKTTTRKLADPDEMEAALRIRDTLTALLAEESREPEETRRMRELREQLNADYTAYVDKYGPVTRYGYAANGNRQNPPTPRFLANDPQFAIVRALETNFVPGEGGDAKSGTVDRASIFNERAASPRELVTSADTPEDALSLSMDTYGRVDLDAIAEMLGVDTTEARRRLGSLVHEVPPLEAEEEDALVARAKRRAQQGLEATEEELADPLADAGLRALREYRGELVPAAEYLSGNVRRKLKIAREAALTDPRFQRSVADLESVIPRELGPDEIDGQLGAVWIPPSDVQQFAAELLGTSVDNVAVTHLGGKWTIKSKATKSFRATQEWGTNRKNTIDLIDAILNKRSLEISTKNKVTGKSEKDMDATLAAQEKADEIRERFSTWIWENSDRARRLSEEYNDRFNGLALRSYDRQNRVYPGMSADWKPRAHQIAAVERIISEPTALLGHVVGAGKTAEMAMGAAELKRLGMARKPAIVVPNHMLEQFTREYLEVYPNAKVLAAGSDDLSGDGRREFIARAATGDWDVVILTQNGFQSIPMSKQATIDYVEQQTAEMRADLERARAMAREGGEEGGQSGRTKRDAADKSVKDMETAIANMTAKLEELIERNSDDTALTFEATGIDYVMVDEAHHYSNLRTPSSMQGVGAAGSGKATDLHMKLEYLRATTRSGRVATFATGTPIRNSVTQAFIMMRYLRPDLLQEAGINSFDDWANTFGETVTEMELKPEGNGFRQNTRFSKFKNVPELLRIFHTFADIKLAEDLKLPRPNLVGGRAENVVVPGSDSLRAYIADLGERADRVRAGEVEPTEDNMLKISMDGRKAALSMSLVDDPETGQPYDHEAGKIEAAADNIAQIHEQYRDVEYPINPKQPDLGMSPDKGGLQVVFMDMGTPKSAAERKKSLNYFDGYEKLREELVARGMDRSRIRFMHEARNDREKAELFAAARSGKIDVLIGSTEKMGVGTNVQARATALHHLDAPWRPADVEQRDGRVLRQGNANPNVRILRYVTEDSFDAYMWQTLERKAKFINQIQKGSLDVREIEDVGDTAMSYAEIKALATGNPDMLEQARVGALHHKLSRLERNHGRQQTNMRNDIGRLEAELEAGANFLSQYDDALTQRVDVSGEKFQMAVDGQPFTKRAEAGEALLEAMKRDRPSYYRRESHVGTVGGFDVELAYYTTPRGEARYAVRLRGVPGDVHTFATEELGRQNGPGLVSRIENALTGMDARRERLVTLMGRHREDLEGLRAKVGQPFPQAALLRAAGAKSARLQAKMELDVERQKAGLSPDAVLELPESDPLRWRPEIDSDEGDDPLVRTDAPAVDAPPTEAAVARAEALADGRRDDIREITSPAGEVDDAAPDSGAGDDEPRELALDATTLDVAHSDARAALTDGDRDAATRALQRMGVGEDDAPALADRLMVVPAREQDRMLDSVERLHTADPNETAVNQRARALVRDDDADTEELTAAEIAEGSGDPTPPEGMTPRRRAELAQLAEDYAGQYGGPNSPTPGADNAARYIMEGHASRDTPIDDDEQQWLRDYIAGRPYLLDREPPDRAELDRRATERATAVRSYLTDAQSAARAGDYPEAERLIGEAERTSPDDTRIARARTALADMRANDGDIADTATPAAGGGAQASSGPAAPPRVEELTRGTAADLGIADNDRIAIYDGTDDADGNPIVMTGEVFGLDGRFIHLSTGAGTIVVGPRNREYQIAKLDSDGRVIPPAGADTVGGSANAGLPATTQPTPETSRARTNRLNAAARLAGGRGGAGSRRVKDGSVHQVFTADSDDAVAKLTEQVDKLGWAGATVQVVQTGSFVGDLGERQRRVEIRVPDTGPDGRPLRTFTAATPAAPDAPEATTPDAPEAPTPAREIADRFATGGTIQDAMRYTPDQLRAGADELAGRGGAANERRADSLRNTAATIEQQQRTGRDVQIDTDTGAPVPETDPMPGATARERESERMRLIGEMGNFRLSAERRQRARDRVTALSNYTGPVAPDTPAAPAAPAEVPEAPATATVDTKWEALHPSSGGFNYSLVQREKRGDQRDDNLRRLTDTELDLAAREAGNRGGLPDSIRIERSRRASTPDQLRARADRLREAADEQPALARERMREVRQLRDRADDYEARDAAGIGRTDFDALPFGQRPASDTASVAAPSPIPAPVDSGGQDFPGPDLDPGDYGRRSVQNFLTRYTTGGHYIQGDARERDRLIRALSDGQLRILEGATIVEARDLDPDGQGTSDVDRARRVLLAATQGEISHRLAGNRRTRRIAEPTEREAKLAGTFAVQQIRAESADRPDRALVMGAAHDILRGASPAEVAAYFTDDEARRLTAGDPSEIGRLLASAEKQPDNPVHAKLAAGARALVENFTGRTAAADTADVADADPVEELRARVQGDFGDRWATVLGTGSGRPDLTAESIGEQMRAANPDDPDGAVRARADQIDADADTMAAALADTPIDEIAGYPDTMRDVARRLRDSIPEATPAPAGPESDDPARFPDAAEFRLSGAGATLMRVRINDVLTGDPAEDDFYGGYVSPDGTTLRVHDRGAMLATIDNELDIVGGNLRPPGGGRATGTPEDRRRWRNEERALVSLRQQVAAMPDQRSAPAVEPEPERTPDAPGRVRVAPGTGRYVDPDEFDDQMARSSDGPEPTYRQDRDNWLEQARRLGDDPTAEQLDRVAGEWSGGQIYRLNTARRELGLAPVLEDRETVSTRSRPGQSVPIRDEVAAARSGPARNRILAELSPEDLRAIVRREQQENRDRGDGGGGGGRVFDRRKRSAYQKRERIIRDVEAELARRGDTAEEPDRRPAITDMASARDVVTMALQDVGEDPELVRARLADLTPAEQVFVRSVMAERSVRAGSDRPDRRERIRAELGALLDVLPDLPGTPSGEQRPVDPSGGVAARARELVPPQVVGTDRDPRLRDTTPDTELDTDPVDEPEMATITREELDAARLPERSAGDIAPADEPEPVDTPNRAAPVEGVDTAAIVAEINRTGNGGTWNAMLEPLAASQRREILPELSFDTLDAMAEYAFMSDDKGWRDQLIHEITGRNTSVGMRMRQAALQQDRQRIRDGVTPARGATAAAAAVANPADYQFAANLAANPDADDAARRRMAVTRGAFPGEEGEQIIAREADRLDDIADRLDAGQTDTYGEPYSQWSERLRRIAEVMRGDTASGAGDEPDYRAMSEEELGAVFRSGAPAPPAAVDEAIRRSEERARAEGAADDAAANRGGRTVFGEGGSVTNIPADQDADTLESPAAPAPAESTPAGEPIEMPRLDGPQVTLLDRLLGDDGEPAGATVDGRTLAVTDPDAFDGWLSEEIARIDRGEGGQGRSQDRKDRRALVRLQTSLEEERDAREERDTGTAPDGGRADGEPAEDGPELSLDDQAFTDDETGDDRPAGGESDRADEGEPADTPDGAEPDGAEPADDAGAGSLPPLDDLGVDASQFDDETDGEPTGPADAADAPAADAPDAAEAPAADDQPDTDGMATISRDEIAEAMDAAQAAEADALGLIEGDDGELEVTEDVAARQTRVERLLVAADKGELNLSKAKDSELTEGRRDVVEELRLQEAVQRRENQRRREARAAGDDQSTTPAAPAAAGADGGGADTGTDVDTPTPAPTPEPAAPKRRPGLAGSVEDLADAVESGDIDAIAAATTRARSSLARSRGDSAAHTELGTLIDQIAAGEQVDPQALRDLATALRDAAKARRNERARARRLVKRLERERLRSLLGQYDAELRTRNRNPDDFGGPAPVATPDDTPDGPTTGPPAGAPADTDTPDVADVAEPGTAAAAGAGQGTPTAVRPTFDRADPDGPAGQARTTELVDGLTTEPWRLLGNSETLFPSTVTAEQRTKMESAARAAFSDLMDTYGPLVRRQPNERIEQARIAAMTRRRRMRTGRATDPAAMTFIESLPAGQRPAFLEAFRTAVADYKRRAGG